MTSTVKKDYVMPIAVLTIICLLISAALAFTNHITAPIIAETEARIAEEARLKVLPAADAFTKLEMQNLPSTVTSVFKANNGAGYVFMLTIKGYGGDMNLICGIDLTGRITHCDTLSHKETAGLGSKTTEAKFKDQFIGKNYSLNGVLAITGATVSSRAYISAISDAFTAYEMAQGVK